MRTTFIKHDYNLTLSPAVRTNTDTRWSNSPNHIYLTTKTVLNMWIKLCIVSAASCFTCDGRTHDHRHRHQAQQEANRLGHIVGPDQLEGDGRHDADEAAVEEPHQQAHGDKTPEDLAHGDHHGHDADDEERRHLEAQRPSWFHLFLENTSVFK